jgi:hypothetical protein
MLGFGPVTELKALMLQQMFMQFVHQDSDLDLCCTLLEELKTGKTRAQLYNLTLSGNVQKPQIFIVLDFLCEQGLVNLLKQRRASPGGLPEAVYKAAPKAFDALIHRLEHEGAASPTDYHEVAEQAKRVAAVQQQVKSAMQRAGWRGSGKRRLRVVHNNPFERSC